MLPETDTDSRVLELLGLEGTEGLIPLGKTIPIASSGPGTAVTTGETQCWTVEEHPDRFESAGLSEAGLSSFINAPLVVHGKAIGALNVARCGAQYEGDHASLLGEIAKLVSTNLERLLALAKARRQLATATQHQQRLELLGELGRRLSATSSEDEAFQVVRELAIGLFPIDRLSLAIPDDDGVSFNIVALSQGAKATPGLAAGDSIPIAQSAFEDILRTGQPGYFPDLSQSPFAEHRRLASVGIQSGMSLAIRAQGQVVACLNCASTDLDAYSPEDQTAGAALSTVLGETLERIRSRDALAQHERQLAAILDDSPLLMMTVDDRGEIVQLSNFGATQLGYDPASLLGEPLSLLYPHDGWDETAQRLVGLAEQPTGAVAVWECLMVNANGDQLRVRHSGRRLLHGSSAATVLVCEDVTKLVELSDRLEHEATHDSLTGLLNRREFDRRLAALIGEDPGTAAGSLCFFDIDHFKIVNDTSGHHAGDALLVELAATLSNFVQEDDALARLGGDEFAVLLPGCSLTDAVRVAERLRKAANDLVFVWNNRTFGTSLSVGVAAIDPSCPDTDDVMGRADAACYEAKNKGRNKVSVAATGEAGSPTSRPDGEWGSRLRVAIQDGQLELASQPIATVDSIDDNNRLELLVRLPGAEDGELVPAALFIPAAERLGIVSEIDRWVVSRAAELLSSGEDRWSDLEFVAVNLSPRSIESDEFLEHLVTTLATPGLDPTKLLFEITETAALSQFSKAVRFIETASAVGCRFALDDFGAGFSTFHYLKRLPVDILKIDGSLVRDLATDPIDRSIVRSIVEVAGTLGMKTIAEFVDDQETVTWLSRLGVDYAQGYGIGRPALVAANRLSPSELA